MRLVRYVASGEARTAVVVDRWVADIAGIAGIAVRSPGGLGGTTGAGLPAHPIPADLAGFLALGATGIETARAVVTSVEAASDEELRGLIRDRWLLSLDEVTFAPPVSPTNGVYCVGRNYADHVAEMGVGLPEAPGIFIRLAATVVGHRQPVVRPIQVSDQLDFEGELAAVIGRPCHRVDPSHALDEVVGYTILNDGSVRDYQKRVSGFLTPGKNFDRSGSLGPWIVTADEIDDVQRLALRTTLNGDVMQAADTGDMIFDVATLVSFISEFASLQPGDVIATGTPSGVGVRREPPRFLVPGDELAIEIDGVGILENTVIDGPHVGSLKGRTPEPA